MTKAELQKRLEDIGLQLDDAQCELAAAELRLADAKAEVAIAKARVQRLLAAREVTLVRLEECAD